MAKILTINEGVVDSEVEQPESSMDCFTSEHTHLIVGGTVTDHERSKIAMQIKDLRGTPMIVPAVSAHVNSVKEAIGVWLNDGVMSGYMRDELTKGSYEELGNVASYLGIRPDRWQREYLLRDRDVDPRGMNHLTKTYSHSVNGRALEQSIIDKMFKPVQEHGANERIERLLILDRADIQLILAQEGEMVEVAGKVTFLYPPVREYLRRFIINQ